jgi:septal ring factor EnvC (AmiA/AmiB activator)
MNQKTIDEWNKEIAKAFDITQEEVDRIVKFQFSACKEAMHTSSTLELTEIGSFSINKKHYYKELRRRIEMIKAYEEKLSKVEKEGRRKQSLENKLASAKADYEFLKDKIKQTKETKDELDQNTGGLEEPFDASKGA